MLVEFIGEEIDRRLMFAREALSDELERRVSKVLADFLVEIFRWVKRNTYLIVASWLILRWVERHNYFNLFN